MSEPIRQAILRISEQELLDVLGPLVPDGCKLLGMFFERDWDGDNATERSSVLCLRLEDKSFEIVEPGRKIPWTRIAQMKPPAKETQARSGRKTG